MKSVAYRLLCMVALAVSLGVAQEKGKSAHRIESFTFDIASGQLSWATTEGTIDAAGTYTEGASKPVYYTIDFTKCTMALMASTLAVQPARRFDCREIAAVLPLLSRIQKYAGDSTAWWLAGEGEPVKEPARTSAPTPGGRNSPLFVSTTGGRLWEGTSK